MSRVLIIKSCKACPFSSMGIKSDENLFGEYYWFCKKERKIVDGDNIPDWCSLPDIVARVSKDEIKDLLNKLDSDIPV